MWTKILKEQRMGMLLEYLKCPKFIHFQSLLFKSFKTDI